MLTYNIPDHLRGDTWNGISSIIFSKDGIPLSLSGSQIDMQFRKDVDAPVTFELSTTNGGIVITDPSNGIIQIVPTLITMQYGTYQYDLEIILADGTVKTYMKGTWKIVPDITHP
jgi:hypothetical protein